MKMNPAEKIIDNYAGVVEEEKRWHPI